jgi:membrane associated rhomboid family serine protease
MLILPLGLDGRLPKRPWATLALGVCVLLGGIALMERVERHTDRLIGAPEWSRERAARQDLRDALCETYDLAGGCPAGGRSRADSEPLARQHRKTLGLWIEHPELVRAEDLRSPKVVTDYLEARAQLEAHRQALNDQTGFVSANSISLSSLVISQFAHGGWVHLLSNLLFLLCFAASVEMRIGRSLLFGLFFVGGAVGLSAQALLSSEPNQAVIGASAGVSAVGGAFFYLFRRASLKLWLFLWVDNRVTTAPVAWAFPIFFVSQDIIGLLAGTSSGVAHLAHLGGLVTGALLAAAIDWFKPVRENFLYHSEMQVAEMLPAQLTVAERDQSRRQIFEWNPRNRALLETELTSAFNEGRRQAPDSISSEFVDDFLARFLDLAIECGDGEAACRVLRAAPVDWQVDRALARLNPTRLRRLLVYALRVGEPLIAWRVAEALHRTKPIPEALSLSLDELAHRQPSDQLSAWLAQRAERKGTRDGSTFAA